MPLISSLFSAACANIAVNNGDVCSKMYDALQKSSTVIQYSEKTETYIQDYGRKLAVSVFTPSELYAFGGVGYMWRTYRTKSATFKLPTLGICDSMQASLTTDSYSISIKWNLPWK